MEGENPFLILRFRPDLLWRNWATVKRSYFSHTVANGALLMSLSSYGPICSIDTIWNRAGSFWPTGQEDPETGWDGLHREFDSLGTREFIRGVPSTHVHGKIFCV